MTTAQRFTLESIGGMSEKLAAIGMRGGIVAIGYNRAKDSFAVVAARNAQGQDLQLPADLAAALVRAAKSTVGREQAGTFVVPDLDPGKPADGQALRDPSKPTDADVTMYGATRPKREDYLGDAPAFYRDLVKWEQSRGIEPGQQGS